MIHGYIQELHGCKGHCSNGYIEVHVIYSEIQQLSCVATISRAAWLDWVVQNHVAKRWWRRYCCECERWVKLGPKLDDLFSVISKHMRNIFYKFLDLRLPMTHSNFLQSWHSSWGWGLAMTWMPCFRDSTFRTRMSHHDVENLWYSTCPISTYIPMVRNKIHYLKDMEHWTHRGYTIIPKHIIDDYCLLRLCQPGMFR